MPFLQRIPTAQDLNISHDRIKPFIHRTPILTSKTINQLSNCNLCFKCENFQKAGSFKIRGATNAILSLNEEEKEKGIITHSSGNHAAALAKAAAASNIKAVIVMPENAPQIKKAAVQSYGAKVVFCKPTIEDRENTVKKLVSQSGFTLIHPFDNYSIIAGQASAAIELLEDVENLDYILTPIGGGGLNSGTCLSVEYFANNVKVIGVEPSGANDAYLSWRDKKLYPQNNPQTICDGLRTPLSNKTFNIITSFVNSIITIEDELTIAAMKLIMETMKIIIEPSSAIVLAAILKEKELFAGKKVGLILSGGNIDLNKLPF